MRPRAMLFILRLAGVLLALGCVAPPLASAREVVLVLDASGSMWGKVGGESKIEAARRTLRGTIEKLPADTTLALIAYGHRKESDCADIETLVPLGGGDRAGLLRRVDELKPKGKTPITGALTEAIALLRGRDSAATVVLVSDGLETCGGDPCAVVRDARRAGVKMVVHVVGFDVQESDVSQLECVAQAGDGLYLEAGDAAQLTAALDRAIAAPAEVPGSRLSIGASANGKPADAVVTVRRAGTRDEVASGRTYVGAETNPRVFALEPGTYDVEVRPLRIDGVGPQTLTAIVVGDGQTVERTAEFGFGEISLRVTRNGKLSDAGVSFFPAGEKRAIDSTRTYTGTETNPRVVKLPAGTYDVEIGALEIQPKPTERLTGVVVEAGKRVEREHDFASGTLRIGAVAGGKLVDAVVRVSPAGTKEAAAQGRTYESAKSNPKEFELAPGRYDVTVSAVKLKDRPARNVTVDVSKGAVTEQVVDLGE